MTRLVVFLPWLVLLGCTHSRADRHAMEREIGAQLAEQSHAAVERVECPADPPLAEGSQFDCQVTFEGGPTLPVHVTMAVARGFHWEPDHLVEAAPSTAAALAKASEADDGRPVVVDCGTGVLVFTDEGVPCTLTGADGGGEITVRQDGRHLSWSPRDAAYVARVLRLQGEEETGTAPTVRCDPTAVKAGVTVRCDITYPNGVTTVARLAFTADSADTAYDPPVVDLERLARSAAGAIHARTDPAAAISCGSGIVAVPPEGVRCTATTATRRAELVVIVSADGTPTVAP